MANTYQQRVEERWKTSFIGRYINIWPDGKDGGPKPKRLRIKEVHNEEPADPSVGIFIGVLTVTCTDGNVYDLLTNGKVERLNDPDDYTKGTVEVGIQAVYCDRW